MIAVLTEAGHVFVEWPFHGEFNERIEQHHNSFNEGPGVRLSEGVLDCATWEINRDFLELPALPDSLLVLDPSAAANTDREEELRIIKIAAGENFVVALTNQGHVLKLDIDSSESLDEIRKNFRNGSKKWIYVSHCGTYPHICISDNVHAY